MPYVDEVNNNRITFEAKWRSEAQRATVRNLATPQIKQSYERLVSLNAWSQLVIDSSAGDARTFLLEAKNDGLISHVLASQGVFRSAMQSMRSLCENVLMFSYYRDHPVELQLWNLQKFAIGANEATKFLKSHPAIMNLKVVHNAIDDLYKEYGGLSKAVHGNVSYRAVTDGKTNLFSESKAKLSIWSGHEKRLLSSINILLMGMYREQLQSTRNPGLRQAVALAIDGRRYPIIKRELGISLTKQT